MSFLCTIFRKFFSSSFLTHSPYATKQKLHTHRGYKFSTYSHKCAQHVHILCSNMCQKIICGTHKPLRQIFTLLYSLSLFHIRFSQRNNNNGTGFWEIEPLGIFLRTNSISSFYGCVCTYTYIERERWDELSAKKAFISFSTKGIMEIFFVASLFFVAFLSIVSFMMRWEHLLGSWGFDFIDIHVYLCLLYDMSATWKYIFISEVGNSLRVIDTE